MAKKKRRAKESEIEQKRAELGLSQLALAVRLGVSRCTVQRWESGKNAPSNLALEKLVEL